MNTDKFILRRCEELNKTATIYGINGPVIYLKGETDFKMSEMVHVGERKSWLAKSFPWTRTARRYRCMRRLPG